MSRVSAVGRTLSLFTRRTPLEEAEVELERELDVSDVKEASEQRTGHPLEMVHEAERAAVRWLGMDVFHEGDDVKVAVHSAGHAVLVLVRTTGAAKLPYASAQIKLSKAQWSKLKSLALEEA